MIPKLPIRSLTQSRYLEFLDALKQEGFAGDLQSDYGNRIALATDNSIYQRLPQAVVYPRHKTDVALICQLLREPRFLHVVVAPRGGGTGTNGQSLTDGIVVDLSRHMNRILEFNPKERWIRVEAGVVKDQLNRYVEGEGLFFAPELSTSNRATIGGMINTDASGQGSCRYGKTRDHVLELESVLLGGEVVCSKPLSAEAFRSQSEGEGLLATIHRESRNLVELNREEIAARFPKLNRCLTGYDLAHLVDAQDRFDLNSLLCGSEGTLAFITEAKLSLEVIPRVTALVNISYDSFQSALEDAHALMAANPTSIETVDSTVLALARNDRIWDSVEEFFPEQSGPVDGINLVEFAADSEAELERQVKGLTERLQCGQSGRMGYTLAWGAEAVKRIWTMRKQAVALLGNRSDDARPIPFVEDTAVPPEKLPAFIAEFRRLLDEKGLHYGMFGHVDAGVLHVRPALDMKDPAQAELIRPVTDAVVKLVAQYGGLLWGEHGKGLRSEYVPEVFGPNLYGCLQQIKSLFDPYNQLNPGKICTPFGREEGLLRIDEVPTRGNLDRRIPEPARRVFSSAVNCNGNGGCFNFDPDDAMCPSWKGTRQRIHSPKGRASLMREWLGQLSDHGFTPGDGDNTGIKGIGSVIPRALNSWIRSRREGDFSHEVLAAMEGCLACKSCISQCPIRVDVPDLRARFLNLYYGRYLRPLRHHLVASLELMTPLLARIRWGYNQVVESQWGQRLFSSVLGMVDSPVISSLSLGRELKKRGVHWATITQLQTLSVEEKERSVILVQDAFTSYFETRLVLDCCDLLCKLGFRVYVAPYSPNGKPLHVHGFLQRFARYARRNARELKALTDCGVPLVGIDPSMTLTYRQEYAKVIEEAQLPKVLLIQEWLCQHLDLLQTAKAQGRVRSSDEFRLMPHCTERTSEPASVDQWQQVFEGLGLTLNHRNTGCCGMAGTYGHEAANLETSQQIYRLSWQSVVQGQNRQERLVATGYSCRSQVKRMDSHQLPHPLQALLDVIAD